MNMQLEGSRIRVELYKGNKKIVLPQKSSRALRFFMVLFLIFWLGMWAEGWVSAAKGISKGNGPADLFLIFWLCAWTVGGVFAIYFLYRLVRPSIPETILLANPDMKYDSGIAPFNINFFNWKSQRDYWKNFFPKRKRAIFTYDQLGTLKLRDFSEGNRLTIDYGHERLELAAGATELEREWLYGVIREHYSLKESSS